MRITIDPYRGNGFGLKVGLTWEGDKEEMMDINR